MGVAELIALAVQAGQAVKIAVDTYEQVKNTLSEDDRAKVLVSLQEAQAETDRLRTLVDAALEEAAKN